MYTKLEFPTNPARTVADALREGTPYSALRRGDLERPFRGVRSLGSDVRVTASDPFAQQRAEHRERVLEYAPLLLEHTFISHESAVAWYDGPLPLRTDDGEPLPGKSLPVHVSVIGELAFPRREGVVGHRATPKLTSVREHHGIAITSPATTWANMGAYPLRELVMLGDYFCRVWRERHNRPPGPAPLATREELATALAAGRRRGIKTLRAALELVREDSWSPKETQTRLALIDLGLPEPALNRDVYDDAGHFLGCLDMAYLVEKVGVEYHGLLHASQYAHDVERIARLRAAGWIIIEVTDALLKNPTELARRVRAALRQRRATGAASALTFASFG